MLAFVEAEWVPLWQSPCQPELRYCKLVTNRVIFLVDSFRVTLTDEQEANEKVPSFIGKKYDGVEADFEFQQGL